MLNILYYARMINGKRWTDEIGRYREIKILDECIIFIYYILVLKKLGNM